MPLPLLSNWVSWVSLSLLLLELKLRVISAFNTMCLKIRFRYFKKLHKQKQNNHDPCQSNEIMQPVPSTSCATNHAQTSGVSQASTLSASPSTAVFRDDTTKDQIHAVTQRRRSNDAPEALSTHFSDAPSTSSNGSEPRPTSPRNCKYDVFLSFRGTDTRNTFVDHLYNHLIRKGIFAFMDDKQLHKGEPISAQLVEAIEDSRISIVVFSKDYAASRWCLDEMATISECHEKLNQQVFSVFYDVDPSHVRKQIGAYENAFVSHTDTFPDRAYQWKRAMTSLANLVGWDVRNKPEFREIENIVQAVIKRLHHRFSVFAEDLVGIQPRIEALESLLKLKSKDDDFRVLGIWGMGGIGKTTHATVLYDRISYQFDACCFIENVSKMYKDGGAVAVQKQILRQALHEKDHDTYSSFEVSGIMRNRLHNIKLLLVLDNVDQLEQLEELAINPKSLCIGSRMIITTRDEHTLHGYGVDAIYEVLLLNDSDARDLFVKKVFKSEGQSSSCMELIPMVLKYVNCLPLAINVVGSDLRTRDAIQWRDALDRFEKNPDNKVMDVLQVSVDGLHLMEKKIFLHIACFFIGEREDYVKRILYSCGLHPHIGIPRIIEKSLIIVKNEEIHMHEMLQELGKKMVRHQYPEEPRLWSRLWLNDDFYHVLMAETGPSKVEAIVLHNPNKEGVRACPAEGFSKLQKLKLLVLHLNNVEGTLSFLSNNLRYLFWDGFPFASLPPKFKPYCLMELNMPNSSIHQLWEGSKNLSFLERVDLSNSKYLVETPNFELNREIKRLDFTGCTNLSKVHPSIGLLTKLVFLSLQNCTSLVSIEFGACSLSSLRVLKLSGCTKLESSPDCSGATNLEYLDLDGCTSLSGVHKSVANLEKLRFLSLRDCKQVLDVENDNLRSLITLDLRGCLKLTYISNIYRYDALISLDVSFCNLRNFPFSEWDLWCLERLNLQGNFFESLPDAISDLSRLAYLNLSHCHMLRYLPKLPTKSTSSTLVGRYFTTLSGSRDHRSGLYFYDCPLLTDGFSDEGKIEVMVLKWLQRFFEETRHFRCGFDIVVPLVWKGNTNERTNIPVWFNHRFEGDSSIKLWPSNFDDGYWIGFAFCVVFEVNNLSKISGSSSHDQLVSLPLPHSFYLSFESEFTEECFNMQLNLKLDEIDGSKYLWIIYISKQHCHFVKTGAKITFRACPGLIIEEWGLRKVDQHPSYALEASNLSISINNENSNNFGNKIQLPYNWSVNEEEDAEISQAKAKENNLSNLGNHWQPL